ncbi:MAG: L-serine ammonia-lyase, iron-sulfur-dependent, subunit beta, partial [Halarsenatibacteraceae bacterium]
IGGGMVELTEFNGFDISIKGDFFESLILIKDVKENKFKEILAEIKAKIDDYEFIDYTSNENDYLINIKRTDELSNETINQISQINSISNIERLSPVLPVMSRKNIKVPFKTIDRMVETASEKNLAMWELATLYESTRGNMPENEVYEKMREIVELMESSIKKGQAGTEYDDRILGPQAWMVKKEAENNKLIPTTILNNVISYAMAVMESKSSMELIVAAPTGGACGVIPGAIIGVADSLNLNKDEIVKAMLSAAIVGIFISEQATFAGEEGGCQAECGSGSGMAAAGLVQLMDGDVQTALTAASLALQNTMGLICDPIANRVEAPCLGRNVMAATNAISSANMALAGVDGVIPLSEVIDTMYRVSKMMSCELRCTGLGGLSVTKTAKKIEKKLKEDKSK